MHHGTVLTISLVRQTTEYCVHFKVLGIKYWGCDLHDYSSWVVPYHCQYLFRCFLLIPGISQHWMFVSVMHGYLGFHYSKYFCIFVFWIYTCNIQPNPWTDNKVLWIICSPLWVNWIEQFRSLSLSHIYTHLGISIHLPAGKITRAFSFVCFVVFNS